MNEDEDEQNHISLETIGLSQADKVDSLEGVWLGGAKDKSRSRRLIASPPSPSSGEGDARHSEF